jgi:hypothetical protein
VRLGLGDPLHNRLQLAPRSGFSIKEVFSLVGGLSFHTVSPSPFSLSSLFSRRLLFTRHPRPVVCGLGFRLCRCKLDLDCLQLFAKCVSPTALGSKVRKGLVQRSL